MNAVVGAVTFGQGTMALNFAEMTGKEAVTALVKIWAVDAAADMSAYTVGYACDELGMPAGITFLASLATGCTVSMKTGKYVFQDARGSIVKELDADGMRAFVKEVDVDSGDLVWGGNKGSKVTNTLTDAQKSRLNALDNTINDHLTDGDFSGTLRDIQGNPVPNGRGGYFDPYGGIN